MKNFIKYILQTILGYERYLKIFSVFKIKTLNLDKKERDFLKFLEIIPKSDGVILDIGANIGIMTCHFAQKFPKNTIYAFEPIPSNYSVLSYIVKKFKLKNVKLFELALGDENGEATMILPKKNKVLFQGLSHMQHEAIDQPLEGIKQKVQIKKLDDIIKEEKIIAIKIDVENFEYFVLKGGFDVIKSNKSIIYAELWQNKNRDACFSLLQELNYSVHFVKKNKIVLFDAKSDETQNFIFIPNLD